MSRKGGPKTIYFEEDLPICPTFGLFWGLRDARKRPQTKTVVVVVVVVKSEELTRIKPNSP